MEEGELPLLQCTETAVAQSNKGEGFLTAGLLGRLLRCEDPFPDTFTSPTVQLCGHPFLMASVYSDPSPFLGFHQQLSLLLNGAEDGWGTEELELHLRKCSTFLHFLLCYAHRYVSSSEQQDSTEKVAMAILPQLLRLHSQLAPLEEQLSTLSGRGQLVSSTNQIAHFSLHIHWTLLCVLYTMAPVTGSTHFLQQAYATLRSLLSYAASTYNQGGTTTLLLQPCNCLCQLWLLLRTTLDQLASSTTSKSFWMLVSHTLGELLPSSEQLEDSEDYAPVEVSDPVLFSWWVLAQLAPVYCYTVEGRFIETAKGRLPSNWVFAQELLPQTFKPTMNETDLRSSLSSLLPLCSLWPACVDPLAKAWEFFHKHMNDSFHLPSRTLQDWLTCEGSTPHQWLQYVHSLCSGDIREERTSYELFLAVLASSVSKGRGEEGEAVWRQLRGRLYSKMHKRWLQELTVTGLRHLVSLFLVLASCTDAGPVGLKMVSHLGVVGLGAAGTSSLLWKGVFSLLLLHEEQALPLTPLLDKLMSHLDTFMKPQPGSCDPRLPWETVVVILDGIQDLVESENGILLGAAGLVGDYLGGLLSRMQGPHLTKLLVFSESVASSVTVVHHSLTREEEGGEGTVKMDMLRAACQSIWQHCALPLVSRATEPLPSPHLATTAASLTVFACECSTLLADNSATVHMFETFALSESTCPSLSTVYLCHVISNDVTRCQLLSTDCAQTQALHVWFRGLVSMHNPPSCTAGVKDLSTVLPRLPLVVALLQETPPPEPLPLLQCFLTAIRTGHSRAPSLSETSQWRERLSVILGDVVRYMEPALSGSASGDSLRTSYRVAAALVKTCPRLIYSKTDSRCLMPRLLDRLLLPIASARRPPVQGTSVCIRAHLHQFLSGLLQLDPRRDDFIRRKIKQVFSKYFHSYSQPRNPLMPNAPNPFLLVLSPCFEAQVTMATGDHLRFTLEVISAQFLILPQQPATLLPTLQYLRTVVQRVRSSQLLVSCTPLLLGHMLSCLLACDVCSRQTEPEGIRRLAIDVLQPMLKDCRDAREITPLLPILRDFVVSNIKQCQGVVFQPLLAIAGLHPSLLSSLLPTALSVVQDAETGRGGGMEVGLRAAYTQLERRVQELSEV